MPTVHWRLSDGRSISDDVANGTNLMDAAVMAGIPSVIGECGGCLSCATCHVYLEQPWASKIDGAGDHEQVMLDSVSGERRDSSRLSCQIIMRESLDGLELVVPA